MSNVRNFYLTFKQVARRVGDSGDFLARVAVDEPGVLLAIAFDDES